VLDIIVIDNQGLLMCHDLFDTMRQVNQIFHLDILQGLKEVEFIGNGLKMEVGFINVASQLYQH
jgi:hypothetical protein